MRVAIKVVAALMLSVALWVAVGLARTKVCVFPPEAEARVNLSAAVTAAIAFDQELDRYDARVAALGFIPERGNRYAYYLAADGPLVDRASIEVTPCPDCIGVQVDSHRHPTAALHATYAATGCPLTTAAVPPFEPMPHLGIRNRPETEAWLFAAAGNIDDDPTLDCWSIASYDRLDSTGEVIPAREPYRELRDREPPGVWARLMRLVL